MNGVLKRPAYERGHPCCLLSRQNTLSKTLQPTALVHEVWLRLAGNRESQWENRRHFFGAASQGMRRILVERPAVG